MIDDAQLVSTLLERQIVDRSLIDRASSIRKEQGGRSLYDVLIAHKLVDEARIVDALAEEYNVPAATLSGVEFNADVIGMLPREMAERTRCLPLEIWVTDPPNKELLLAMEDPLDMMAMDDVATHTGVDIRPVLVGPRDLSRAMERAYAAAESFRAGQDSDDSVEVLSLSDDDLFDDDEPDSIIDEFLIEDDGEAVSGEFFLQDAVSAEHDLHPDDLLSEETSLPDIDAQADSLFSSQGGADPDLFAELEDAALLGEEDSLPLFRPDKESSAAPQHPQDDEDDDELFPELGSNLPDLYGSKAGDADLDGLFADFAQDAEGSDDALDDDSDGPERTAESDEDASAPPEDSDDRGQRLGGLVSKLKKSKPSLKLPKKPGGLNRLSSLKPRGSSLSRRSDKQDPEEERDDTDEKPSRGLRASTATEDAEEDELIVSASELIFPAEDELEERSEDLPFPGTTAESLAEIRLTDIVEPPRSSRRGAAVIESDDNPFPGQTPGSLEIRLTDYVDATQNEDSNSTKFAARPGNEEEDSNSTKFAARPGNEDDDPNSTKFAARPGGDLPSAPPSMEAGDIDGNSTYLSPIPHEFVQQNELQDLQEETSEGGSLLVSELSLLKDLDQDDGWLDEESDDSEPALIFEQEADEQDAGDEEGEEDLIFLDGGDDEEESDEKKNRKFIGRITPKRVAKRRGPDGKLHDVELSSEELEAVKRAGSSKKSRKPKNKKKGAQGKADAQAEDVELMRSFSRRNAAVEAQQRRKTSPRIESPKTVEVALPEDSDFDVEEFLVYAATNESLSADITSEEPVFDFEQAEDDDAHMRSTMQAFALTPDQVQAFAKARKRGLERDSEMQTPLPPTPQDLDFPEDIKDAELLHAVVRLLIAKGFLGFDEIIAEVRREQSKKAD